jgi:hypothetical protein
MSILNPFGSVVVLALIDAVDAFCDEDYPDDPVAQEKRCC